VKFLSVCSGIEAASVAWNPLGWKAVAFSEIERFPSAVLAHHYPDGYTAIPKAADGPRYKALGNSMATPVVRWIGERIQLSDKP
jgi:site-specific DNA-cytosine methylase